MGVYLSVIIPCYNESANLKRHVLGEVNKYLTSKDFKWEVIVSDDGSSDDSVKIIKTQIKNYKNFKLLLNTHGGKPHALFHGIQASLGEYVLFTDMDQSTPIAELDKLLPYAAKFKAVIGSRGLTRPDFPIYRKLGALVFATFRRSMILPDLTDTQCGFKLFKRSVVAKAFPKLEFFKQSRTAVGWKVTSYDVELLHIIEKMGSKIKEVTVSWNDRDVSRSKGSHSQRYIKESREMLAQIIRVKLNDLRGFY